MANNANVNKVEYGGQTLIDLTGDSVAANKLLRGETAHDRSGAQITGTLDTIPTFIGTQAEWEQLSAAEQAAFLMVEFTDDGGYGNAYDIPYNSSNVGDSLDGIKSDLSNKQNKDWTLIDYKDGSTSMTIINNKSEYYLSVNIEKAGIFVDTIVIPNLFDTSERQFRFGYWGVNNSAGAIVKIQKNNDNTITVILYSASRDNSSVTSASRLAVYGR